MKLRLHRHRRSLQMRWLVGQPWQMRGLHRKTRKGDYCYVIFSDGAMQMVDL